MQAQLITATAAASCAVGQLADAFGTHPDLGAFYHNIYLPTVHGVPQGGLPVACLPRTRRAPVPPTPGTESTR